MTILIRKLLRDIWPALAVVAFSCRRFSAYGSR
jgi:hypothetical protein